MDHNDPSSSSSSSSSTATMETPASAAKIIDEPAKAEEATTESSGEQQQQQQFLFIEHLFSQLRNAQLQNGLRHGAYDRYRRYCTRRLARLRKQLHCTHRQLKKPKSATAGGASADQFYVKPQIAPEHIHNVKYLWIPLLCAERAWAHAVQIKTENTTGDDRKRHHAHRKFVKASKYATKFFQLCESLASTSSTKKTAATLDLGTLVEADAYTAWMQGLMFQESALWDEAIASYTRSRFLFHALMHLALLPEHSQVLATKLSEIDTSIRFCFFSLTKRIPQDVKEVVERYERQDTAMFDTLRAKVEAYHQLLHAQAAENKARMPSEIDRIKFRGREVPIEQSHRHLRSLFTRAEALRAEIATVGSTSDKRELEKKYSDLHSLYAECVSHLNEYIKHNKDQSEEQRAATHFLHTYSSYLASETTLRRRALGVELLEAKFYDWRNKSCDASRKASQVSAVRIVKAYDQLLQTLSELEQIPGIEEDDTLTTELTRQTAIFKAKRSLFLAESFAENTMFAEALVMFGKAQELIGGAKKLGVNIDNIMQQLLSGRSIAHAELVETELSKQQSLESVMSTLSVSSNAPADTKKASQQDGKQPKEQLVSCPVQHLEFVPPKPIFFDIALDQVNYPETGAPAAEEEKPQPKPQPKPQAQAQAQAQPPKTQPQAPAPVQPKQQQPSQQKEATPSSPTTTTTQEQEKKGWFSKWF